MRNGPVLKFSKKVDKHGKVKKQTETATPRNIKGFRLRWMK